MFKVPRSRGIDRQKKPSKVRGRWPWRHGPEYRYHLPVNRVGVAVFVENTACQGHSYNAAVVVGIEELEKFRLLFSEISDVRRISV